MLSLKDFKKFEVKSDGLKNVIGGINCNQIDDVLDALEGNPQQSAVYSMLYGSGVQCQWGNATCRVGLYVSEGQTNSYVAC